MKKLICLLLAVLVLAAPVYADVIWEPYNDTYYDKNRDSFTFYRASYYANSPEGQAVGYDKPGGKEVIQIENGTNLSAEYQCTAKDGSVWVLSEIRLNDRWDSVYIPLDSLLDCYDKEFFADHAGEIMNGLPQDVQENWDGGDFLFWSYPGGSYTVMRGEYFAERTALSEICDQFYWDDEGNLWGYVGYYMGNRESWICLNLPNDPGLQKPEIFTGPVYFGDNPDTPPETPPASQENGSMTGTYIAIGAAVLAAAMLLVLPKKKS